MSGPPVCFWRWITRPTYTLTTGFWDLTTFLGRILAGWVRQYRSLNTDLEAVVDEWASSLFLEMDHEAKKYSHYWFLGLDYLSWQDSGRAGCGSTGL